MTSADSPNSQFDDLLLAIGSELAGERTEPVSLDVADTELQRRIAHARQCLMLLQGLTREYSADELAAEPIESRERSSSSGIRAPSKFQRFQLIQQLGAGGFAEVFLADDPLLHRQVAIKIPHAKWVADPNARRRFLREARALGQLRHPAIVTVFESGEHDGIPFLVMEHCDAGNLDQLLSSLPQRQEPRGCAALVHQIAEGLGLAHQLGILHRDVKPRNVLLTHIKDAVKVGDGPSVPLPSQVPDWKNIQPKLSDFGLAKWLDDEFDANKTQTGFVAGTLQYMAPEQASGKSEQVSAATDVHGLGVILYEMLTGQPPFAGDSTIETSWNILNRGPIAVRTLRPAVPRDLETICHKALEKDPARRYPTAQEMAEDLQRFLEDRAILAKPVSLPEKALRWCRHHPELGLLLCVLCVSVTLISAGGWWYSSRLSTAFETETRLREQETRLLEDSKQREADLLQQTERLEKAVRSEQLLAYTSRMRHIQDLYDRGQILSCTRKLNEMRPSSSEGPDFRDFSWRLMNAKCGGELRPFEVAINTNFYSVNVIKEKGCIIAGKRDGAFYAWDLISGNPIASPVLNLAERQTSQGVTYHPRSDVWTFLATETDDSGTILRGYLNFWNVSAGLTRSVRIGEVVARLMTSPDGSRFVVDNRRSGSQFFEVYLTDNGAHIWSALAGENVYGRSLAWSPDGSLAVPMLSHVAIYSSEGELTAKLAQNPEDAPLRIVSAAVSSDGGLIAGLREDQAIDIWKRASDGAYSFEKTIRFSEITPGNVNLNWPNPYGIQFLNRDTWLAVANADFHVRLWNLQTNRIDGRSPRFNDNVTSITPLPDGTLLLSEYGRGLYRWSPVADGPTFAGHSRETWTVDYSPDGRYLASGSDDGTMKVWDVATGRELDTSDNHTQTVVQARFSPSGSQLASLCLDGSLRIWEVDTTSGKLVGEPRKVDGHAKARSLTWSPDGQIIATGHNDGNVVLWDARTLQIQRRFADHHATVRQILFLDAGQTLVTVSNADSVCVRDLSGKDHVVRTWREVIDVYCVALLPDGDTLAVGQKLGGISLRSRSTGQLIGSLTGHEVGVAAMALSPDGKVLATGDEAGWLRLWRTENHQPLVSIRIGEHKIHRLTFSPQGDAIAIATHDGKVTTLTAPFVK